MTDRELMQQALDVLEDIFGKNKIDVGVINRLRDRLAQPEQKPVAWMYVNTDGECEQIEYETPPDDPSVTPLYTTPRKWQGLTDEEIAEIAATPAAIPGSYVVSFARAIEAKLKEKNT